MKTLRAISWMILFIICLPILDFISVKAQWDLSIEINLFLWVLWGIPFTIFILLWKRMAEKWLKGVLIGLFTLGFITVALQTGLLSSFTGCDFERVAEIFGLSLLLYALTFISQAMIVSTLLYDCDQKPLYLLRVKKRYPLIKWSRIIALASLIPLMLYPLIKLVISMYDVTLLADLVLVSYFIALIAFFMRAVSIDNQSPNN